MILILIVIIIVNGITNNNNNIINNNYSIKITKHCNFNIKLVLYLLYNQMKHVIKNKKKKALKRRYFFIS